MTATVPGFAEALRNMKVGSKWIIYVPPEQGFADRGDELVGPAATLVYEAELLGIGDPREESQDESADRSDNGATEASTGRGLEAPASGDPR